MSRHDQKTKQRVAQAIAGKEQIYWSDAKEFEVDYNDYGPVFGTQTEATKDVWRLQVHEMPPTSSEKYRCRWTVHWWGTGDPPALSSMGGRTRTLEGAQKMAESAFGLLEEMKGFLDREKVEGPEPTR